MLCPIGTELVGSRNDSHTSESEEEETEKGVRYRGRARNNELGQNGGRREMGKAAYRKHGRGETCKLHMYRGRMDGEN